jgi:hypothetical protein
MARARRAGIRQASAATQTRMADTRSTSMGSRVPFSMSARVADTFALTPHCLGRVNCRAIRPKLPSKSGPSNLETCIGDNASSTEPAAAEASTKENPRLPYATGSAGLATTVRGSSRRIMIMQFRRANIRLINRRPNLPGCCSLCPREKAKGNYKPQVSQSWHGHSLSGQCAHPPWCVTANSVRCGLLLKA